LCLLLSGRAPAQDIEPRRWTVMPLGVNVVGAGYGHTSGEIFVDPVLRIEDAEFDANTLGVSYVRSFSLGGKLARFDALVPWSSVRWRGLLDGQPAATERTGLADPRLRLSVILGGPPAMEAGELRSYMAGRPVHTVFGAAIAVTVPWGKYLDDKLLNLGQNRFTIRPQIGVVHTRGPWSYELTASTFVFSDNDDFFGGSKLEQDPLYAVQGHVIRMFKPGLWASLSAGYGWGGRYTLDGERRNERADFLAAFSVGFPLGRRQGLKIAYLRSETREATGSESDTLAIAWSVRY
jgi:hypothetical protein